MVTSVNYEKYVTFNGVLYSHIIDPRTGYPSTGILSASIFVMGLDTGLDFINQLKGVECIIVDKDNTVHTSKNINIETIN